MPESSLWMRLYLRVATTELPEFLINYVISEESLFPVAGPGWAASWPRKSSEADRFDLLQVATRQPLKDLLALLWRL